MSLLQRLLLLVFLALIPAAIIEIENEVELRASREAEVRQTALRFAQLYAAEQERMMEGVRQILFTIAQTPVIRHGTPADCQGYLERLRPGLSPHLRIRVVGLDRTVRCATEPGRIGQAVGNRRDLRAAVEEDGLVIGKLLNTPADEHPLALPVTLPIHDGGGVIIGLVSALIDLGWLGQTLEARPLPNDFALVAFDRGGTVLARVPDIPGVVGRQLPPGYHSLLVDVRAPTVLDLPGFDRKPMIVGAVPLGNGVTGMGIAVSVERNTVLGPIEEAMLRALGLIAAVMLLTLLAAWWGADRFLRKPAHALVEAAQRWSRGDLSARTGLANGHTEISMLGRAFDSMAEALQRQAKAQKEANALAHKAASVLSSTTDGVFEIDRSWRITFMNDRARALLGNSLDLTGRRLPEAFPESADSVFASYFHRAMAGTGIITFEAFYPPRQAWYAVRVFPSRKGGLAVFFQDVTELRRAEASRRGSEACFRAVFELAAVGIERLGCDGRYLDVNVTLCAILGYERDELLGMTFRELTDPADLPKEEVLLAALMNGAVPSYAIEKRYIHRDGRPIWVRVVSSFSPNMNTDEPYRISIVEDISERKIIETQLNTAKEEAEHANLAKSKFLAAASHDLRQPLQSLFFFSAALARHVPDDNSRGRELLHRLDQGLDALKGLLDSLLDVSRLDSGVVTPRLEAFSVAEIADAIDAAYAPLAAEKGLGWMVESCDMTVCSDRTLLGRLVRNLVENALRYTQAGLIRVRCRQEGDRVAIEVQDTGIGIPDEHLERIFEEFHQVGNPERDRAQGLGLGLAIVRRLSQLLDHPVEVRSVHGRGSAFRVLVPLGEQEPRFAEDVAAQPDGEGRLAVLVDDDAVVLLGLRMVLLEWGYQVLAAESADRAMERLDGQQRRPDIVIADYRLREGRVGTEVIRRIRERYGPDVPGLILTGETGADSLRDAADHNVPVIHKPVTPRQLWAEVERQLQAAE